MGVRMSGQSEMRAYTATPFSRGVYSQFTVADGSAYGGQHTTELVVSGVPITHHTQIKTTQPQHKLLFIKTTSSALQNVREVVMLVALTTPKVSRSTLTPPVAGGANANTTTLWYGAAAVGRAVVRDRVPPPEITAKSIGGFCGVSHSTAKARSDGMS